MYVCGKTACDMLHLTAISAYASTAAKNILGDGSWPAANLTRCPGRGELAAAATAQETRLLVTCAASKRVCKTSLAHRCPNCPVYARWPLACELAKVGREARGCFLQGHAHQRPRHLRVASRCSTAVAWLTSFLMPNRQLAPRQPAVSGLCQAGHWPNARGC